MALLWGRHTSSGSLGCGYRGSGFSGLPGCDQIAPNCKYREMRGLRACCTRDLHLKFSSWNEIFFRFGLKRGRGERGEEYSRAVGQRGDRERERGRQRGSKTKGGREREGESRSGNCGFSPLSLVWGGWGGKGRVEEKSCNRRSVCPLPKKISLRLFQVLVIPITIETSTYHEDAMAGKESPFLPGLRRR